MTEELPSNVSRSHFFFRVRFHFVSFMGTIPRVARTAFLRISSWVRLKSSFCWDPDGMLGTPSNNDMTLPSEINRVGARCRRGVESCFEWG